MRRRIVTLAVLAAVLAISLFGVPFAIGLARSYIADERAELSRLVTGATVAVAPAQLAGGDPIELPRTEPDMTLGVYDASGRKITGRGPVHADGAVRAALRGSAANESRGPDIVVAVPVADNERVTGAIRAATGKQVVYRRIARTWLIMLGVALLAVGLTAILAQRQARRLARPLEEMSADAQRLSDGDLSVRTRPSGIPEIDSVSASLNATAERLGDLLARERAFSADASHQLRTPLTGLRLTLEAMRDTPAGASEKAITTAIAATNRLQTIIDDLLALARDVPDHSGTLDAKVLIDEIRQNWHAGLAAHGRPLRLTIEPDPPSAHASTAAVRQILNVLIDNAARHGAGPVTVSVRDAGDALAVDVVDEGPGISRPPDEIFRRRAAGTPGHGIGLAMARSLAEAEGGRLLLTRPVPATFTLLLPLARD
ncbi:HAMP domain-containing sensor histidine kinase [Actinoallomurus liliacearum]|uniref:Signal transduction histidine-protein kinase/phosphatase MprB n=1 Tax=Actinoallomurus liliacearum TaxID=1080073 RepID=A0ABP8TVA0_9ACTN